VRCFFLSERNNFTVFKSLKLPPFYLPSSSHDFEGRNGTYLINIKTNWDY